MGYTWTDGELITATKLNNTGGGGTSGLCTVTEGTLDKSYNDLLGMLNDGVVPYIVGESGSMSVVYTLIDLDVDGDYYADFYSKTLDETLNGVNASADGNISFD